MAVLELGGGIPEALAVGDVCALTQPIGFGLGYYLTEKLMKDNPGQTLPITAVQTAVVGVVSLVWMFGSGFVSGRSAAGTMFAGVPSVAVALVYTGLVTTALTRIGETKALKSLSATDASFILTTEVCVHVTLGACAWVCVRACQRPWLLLRVLARVLVRSRTVEGVSFCCACVCMSLHICLYACAYACVSEGDREISLRCKSKYV